MRIIKQEDVMKFARYFTRIIIPVLILVVFSSIACSSKTESVYIIHTNDFHGRIYGGDGSAGFANIAGFIQDKKSMRADVLVLDAGDFTSGTAVSTLFKGESVIRIMSEMGYDAVTLGNHEFDHGWKNTERLENISSIPFICANAFKPDGTLVADNAYKLYEIDGVTVGIIGIIAENTPLMIVKSGNENLKFKSEIEILSDLVPKVRKQCDILIVLSHAGIKKDRQIASQIAGIDIIVGGHSHKLIEHPEKVSNTYIVQAHCNGTDIGWLDVIVDCDADTLIALDGGVINQVNLTLRDHDVQALVDNWDNKVAAQIDIKIASASKSYTIIELHKLFADILKDVKDADLGFMNRGGIRDDIIEGPVTIRDIWEVFPFENLVTVVSVRGGDIEGHFKEYTRIMELTLLEDKVYKIVTNNYVGDHVEEFFGPKASITENTQLPVKDVVIDYIRKNGL